MNKDFKVLMVEDSVVDAELILFKLRMAGCEVEYILVDNAQDTRKSLIEEKWDIILCDYTLPDFDPYKVLDILKEYEIDIPLIVISGKIGEDNAIKLMKAGCHDCIMKSDLSRLPEVINREIREAKIRAENMKLKNKLEKYQILAEEANDAMLFLDMEGNILDVNYRAIKEYGYSFEEFVTMNVIDMRFEPDKLLVNAQMDTADKNGIVFETVHIRKDKTVFYVEVSSQGTILDGKRVLISIIRDITERKKSEELLRNNEERYKTLSQTSMDGFFVMDIDGRLTEINDAYCLMSGYSRFELLSMNISDLDITETKEKVYARIERIIETGSDKFETKHRKADGSLFDVQNNVNYIASKALLLCFISDITKRKIAENELKLSLQKYKQLLTGTVTAFSTAMEVRDPYTSGHQIRVSKIATAIAQSFGLNQQDLDTIRISGLLHDLGKMYVPAEILSKPTKLSDLEFSMIKVHSEAGYNILKSIDFEGSIAEIVYQHHEKMDGSGYPRQLKGEQILKEARILCVADVVEAMMSNRPYRSAIGLDAALAEIEQGTGTKYDVDCVRACVKLFRDEGFEL